MDGIRAARGTIVVILLSVLLCSVVALQPGYSLSNIKAQPWGTEADLQQITGSQGPYGGDINQLKLFVYYQTEDILRIKIVDPNNQRWEVPDVIQVSSPPSNVPTTRNYKVTLTNNPFGIAVTRTTDGAVLWNTTSPTQGAQFNGLLFEDQYIEWSTQMVSQPKLYGLGERVDSFLLNTTNNDYVMFNRDQGTPVKTNLYGTHPVYMEIRPGQSGVKAHAHGVFFLNTNAMNVHVEKQLLTYQTIGGVLDVWMFMGPSPKQVISQYLSVVGLPHFPPYWELGFHQCRWGYQSIDETASVAYNYRRFNIPLDTMWNDIDYMNGYRDFTTDPVHFPLDQVVNFVDYLHDHNQQYIVIIDPGIKTDPNYNAFIEGLEQDIFMKQGVSEKLEMIGQVWPGYTMFPDFTNSSAREYWQDQIKAFRDSGVAVDGLWIDMNEISNFCTGNCVLTNDSYILSQYTLQNDPYDNPPFTPTANPLNTSTISMNTRTSLGLTYNTHNLFAFYESIATDTALENLRNQRSVVISRSSFSGSGKYTSHWLGDNTSTWNDLYYSIAGVLNFQFFGIPMVGADICGFNGNTTEELCSRWMQLGSFYPFSRNHNSIGSSPQEPWAFDSPQHIDITRKALNMRYLLLPYFYTLIYEASTTGSTVWNALIWEFVDDVNCLSIDAQFMVGEGILVTPVLQQNQTSVTGYFPAAYWYDFYTGDQIGSPSTGSNVVLSAPMDIIPVALRGGYIIPTQLPALTTFEARKNPIVLLVPLDGNGEANGYMYFDDGKSLNTFAHGDYTIVQFNSTASSVSSRITKSGYNISNLFLGEVKVFGVTSAVTSVTVNGAPTLGNFRYIPAHNTLIISGLFLPMSAAFTVSWS